MKRKYNYNYGGVEEDLSAKSILGFGLIMMIVCFAFFSLIFVSCQTKTEAEAKKIQQEARDEMGNLPYVDVGINTDTLCKH